MQSKPFTEEIADSIIELVIRCFKVREEVFEEAFLVISAIAGSYENYIGSKVGEIAPFIMHALESKAPAVVRNSCGIISEIASADPESLVDGIESLVEPLINILKNKELERSVKIPPITALADLFSVGKNNFVLHFDIMMKIFSSASKKSTNYSEIEDDDLYDYLMQL